MRDIYQHRGIGLTTIRQASVTAWQQTIKQNAQVEIAVAAAPLSYIAFDPIQVVTGLLAGDLAGTHREVLLLVANMGVVGLTTPYSGSCCPL